MIRKYLINNYSNYYFTEPHWNPLHTEGTDGNQYGLSKLDWVSYTHVSYSKESRIQCMTEMGQNYANYHLKSDMTMQMTEVDKNKTETGTTLQILR